MESAEEREHPITRERIIKWGKTVVSAFGGAAIISAAWISWGWPIPATNAYVDSLVIPITERITNLELVILRQKQGLLLEEILDLEEQRKAVSNGFLNELIRIKSQEVREIEDQITIIEEDRKREKERREDD